MGFQKSYVIFRVGHGKGLRLITRWVGGVKKGQKRAYLVLEWSLRHAEMPCVPVLLTKESPRSEINYDSQPLYLEF